MELLKIVVKKLLSPTEAPVSLNFRSIQSKLKFTAYKPPTLPMNNYTTNASEAL